ncbi:hypothetical protein ABTO89_18990, partial [Acinetobacter baumannii]
ADYLRGFGERLGYALTLDEWVETRRRAMRADRAMIGIARGLSASVEVAVLTNNTTLVAEHIERLLPELRPVFGAKIFASAQFGTAKPDPHCYRLCLS